MLVALLAEGVDRNNQLRKILAMLDKSPSSRRAWIEIIDFLNVSVKFLVALLAEGVDRNLIAENLFVFRVGRPPRGGRG